MRKSSDKPSSALRLHRVPVNPKQTPKQKQKPTPAQNPLASTQKIQIPRPKKDDITVAYAKCLELMMTAPMSKESEQWRDTIIKSKPSTCNFMATPRPVMKRNKAKQTRNNENRTCNFIGGVTEGDTFFN